VTSFAKKQIDASWSAYLAALQRQRESGRMSKAQAPTAILFNLLLTEIPFALQQAYHRLLLLICNTVLKEHNP